MLLPSSNRSSGWDETAYSRKTSENQASKSLVFIHLFSFNQYFVPGNSPFIHAGLRLCASNITMGGTACPMAFAQPTVWALADIQRTITTILHKSLFLWVYPCQQQLIQQCPWHPSSFYHIQAEHNFSSTLLVHFLWQYSIGPGLLPWVSLPLTPSFSVVLRTPCWRATWLMGWPPSAAFSVANIR